MTEKAKDAWEKNTPTNGQTARRGYCTRHSRVMIDIGGTKQCPQCKSEPKKAAK